MGAIAIILSLKEAEFVAVSEVWRWRILYWVRSRRRRRGLLDNNWLNLCRSRYGSRYRRRCIILYSPFSTLFLLLLLLLPFKEVSYLVG
jgi:Zn-finger domain-containing protein